VSKIKGTGSAAIVCNQVDPKNNRLAIPTINRCAVLRISRSTQYRQLQSRFTT
jgi:hypothetical protein